MAGLTATQLVAWVQCCESAHRAQGGVASPARLLIQQEPVPTLEDLEESPGVWQDSETA